MSEIRFIQEMDFHQKGGKDTGTIGGFVTPRDTFGQEQQSTQRRLLTQKAGEQLTSIPFGLLEGCFVRPLHIIYLHYLYTICVI